jgi:energy-coupling factor transporter transmembrane protein EcfT
MQICQPRTASQSWNTDNWCWVDWAGMGLVACFIVLVFALVGAFLWSALS